MYVFAGKYVSYGKILNFWKFRINAVSSDVNCTKSIKVSFREKLKFSKQNREIFAVIGTLVILI